MSIGFLALLDDIVGLSKVAAASLDDVAAQAAKAGVKAAGVVIDDAAVTPRYVVGFKAERELPIVGKIALGSLKNKLLFLLPAALVLGLVAPWIITPLLMLGGAYLCYEGSEKVFEAIWPHHAQAHETASKVKVGAATLEDQKVGSAIKTDFILSAEIMAITLASVSAGSFWTQAIVLAAVGVGITLIVYGGVALIVKADDVGVALAKNDRPMSTLLRRSPAAPTGGDRALRILTQGFGVSLVRSMPVFLTMLSVVGTAAMIWVGGGIIIHGLEGYGLPALGHIVHAVAGAASQGVPVAHDAVTWAVTAGASGVFGLVVGAVLIPVVQYGIAPMLRAVRPKRAEQSHAA